jgi:hypothetical protein
MQQVYHCHCDYPSNKVLNIQWFHSNNNILQGLLTRILLISPLPSGKHTKTLNYHTVSLTIVIIRYCVYALASGNPTGQARKSTRNGGFFHAIKGELSIATFDYRSLHPWIYPFNHHNKTLLKKNNIQTIIEPPLIIPGTSTWQPVQPVRIPWSLGSLAAASLNVCGKVKTWRSN